MSRESRDRTTSWHRIGTVMAATTFVVVGCGGASDESSGSMTPVETFVANGESLDVQVLDNSFRPVEYTIEAGTEVVFENRGRNDHNILPDDVGNDGELTERFQGGDDRVWGVIAADFVPGDTYSRVFTAPGTYAYYCSIHGSPGAGMYGVLVVVEPGAS